MRRCQSLLRTHHHAPSQISSTTGTYITNSFFMYYFYCYQPLIGIYMFQRLVLMIIRFGFFSAQSHLEYLLWDEFTLFVTGMTRHFISRKRELMITISQQLTMVFSFHPHHLGIPSFSFLTHRVKSDIKIVRVQLHQSYRQENHLLCYACF